LGLRVPLFAAANQPASAFDLRFKFDQPFVYDPTKGSTKPCHWGVSCRKQLFCAVVVDLHRVKKQACLSFFSGVNIYAVVTERKQKERLVRTIYVIFHSLIRVNPCFELRFSFSAQCESPFSNGGFGFVV
jgi:hypothetical protein